jgi:hypothetical protein
MYDSHVRNHTVPMLGRRPMGSLRRTDISAFVVDLTRKQLATATVVTIYRVLAMSTSTGSATSPTWPWPPEGYGLSGPRGRPGPGIVASLQEDAAPRCPARATASNPTPSSTEHHDLVVRNLALLVPYRHR